MRYWCIGRNDVSPSQLFGESARERAQSSAGNAIYGFAFRNIGNSKFFTLETDARRICASSLALH